jgi:hypothetical protein
MGKGIKIEKGVPVAETPRSPGVKPIYPWKEMEVGDSFLFRPNVGRQSAYNASSLRSGRMGRRYVVRSTPEGMRCWRVE